MLKTLLVILISTLTFFPSFAQENYYKIFGKVYNSANNPLENCNIYISKIQKGTTTDSLGNFSLILSSGNFKILFSYVGFESQEIQIKINKNDIELNVELKPKILDSEEVEVTAKREHSTIVIQKIENKDIQKMPTIYSDVLRSVQVLSGVATNTELSSGYNVRGGSFDENLIYLNGYEIYRPFLLRVGVEENQTTINPNMVENLTFFNGAFPASFGDRMSSALDVNYTPGNNEKLRGSFYASLLNMGINLKNKNGNFDWNLGVRYANPSAFLGSLKAQGDYKPSFSDIQLLANYKISTSSKLEFLGIYADNKFDISPTNWTGNFGYLGRGDYRGVTIESDGEREYSYKNSLLGLKYIGNILTKSQLKISLLKYWVSEKENYDLTGNIFYFPNAFNPDANREFLKSRYEKGNNLVELNSYRFKFGINSSFKNHNLSIGGEYRIEEISNRNFENFYEVGDSLLNERPINREFKNLYNINSLSFFVEDYFLITPNLEANIGVRFLKYGYSNENLFSPRAYLIYQLSDFNKFKFSWGYYYQPPFLNELKSTQIKNLKSQRSVHYVLGWEKQVNPKLKFNAEVYYKDLDNIIPFYFDEFRMVYVDENNREGYAFGIDLMYEGEIVEGMKSWVGYSYLDTKERKVGERKYQRRLLDQTHTLQIFLQDKMRKHPNWQSHLRFLLGSGFLYYNRKLITDAETSQSYIDVDFNNPQEYFFYFRVDMGLSASFNLGKGYKITGIAEVLNVFNQLNAGAYEWVHIFKEIKAPLNIPHVLTKRFFNIKAEISF